MRFGWKAMSNVVLLTAALLSSAEVPTGIGREVFRYVGKSNQDRFSFDKLKARIIELTSK